jgi:hypothetical protein
MKKTLFILGLLLSVAFIYAQNLTQKTSDYVYAGQEMNENSSAALDGCPSPKKFAVTQSDDCVATMTWYAPTDVLFDHAITTNRGNVSMRWLLEEENSRYIRADDFIVPAGEKWIITEVYMGGFYKTGGDDPHVYEAPDYIGVEIYYDGGNELPGTLILEDAMLTPITGSIGNTCTVLLSEPLELTNPGKYWIAIYGTYAKKYDDERRFYVYLFEEEIGSPLALFDEETGSWSSIGGSSLYFKIQGYKTDDPVLYNIYLDGTMIEHEISSLEYTTSNYDASKKHTWSITAICSDGGESPFVHSTTKVCNSINENVISFSITPNPANDNIKITTEAFFNTLEVVNYLGQTVISQPNTETGNTTIDISNLTGGIYFVRLISDHGVAVQKFIKQ